MYGNHYALHQSGGTIWLTGLSGAGKTTIARSLRDLLVATLGSQILLIDGDDLREGLNSDLGFGEADRAENVRRLGEIAILFASLGCIAIVSAISPYVAGREAVRHRHDAVGVGFFEVYVATSLEVCEARDVKGLYARARRGEIPQFTGISAPYEPPESPDLTLNTTGTPKQSAREVLWAMRSGMFGHSNGLYQSSTRSESLSLMTALSPH